LILSGIDLIGHCGRNRFHSYLTSRIDNMLDAPSGLLIRFTGRFTVSLLPLALTAILLISSTPLFALTVIGDVTPADPNTWDSGTHTHIGNTGSGELSLNSTDQIYLHHLMVALDSGSYGIATVDGPGSKCNTQFISVGTKGNGRLNITNGGVVENSPGYIGYYIGSTGTVMVDGPGSTFSNSSLYVGHYGSGILNITNGAEVNSSGVKIGYYSSSTGAVMVDGPGSTLKTSTLRLYRGTIDVTAGGAISSFSGWLRGAVNISDPGSIWTNTSDLHLGYDGSGTLDISNGGTVSSKNLYIGDDGKGTLNISDTSLLRVSNMTHLEHKFGNQSTINFNGGTLDTGTLFANDSDLSGTGTIIQHGVITDDTLVLDSIDDITGYFRTINSKQNQNITVNLNIDGQGSLGAGWTGTGSLTIKDSLAVASANGYLGYESGSSGTVTVDGPGSTWTNNNRLYVGFNGRGRLHITGGAAVNNYGCYIGFESGSTGAVTVDGPDSTWTNSSGLVIGRYGNGTLNITNGAAVSNGSSCIGNLSGSSGAVTVDGPGSTLTNSSQIKVGDLGNGTLNITNGAAVSSSHGIIGYRFNSTGTVKVDGPGSTWASSGDLYVGKYGSGILNISNSALVNVLGTTHIAYDSNSQGRINFDGGTLDTGSLWADDKNLSGTGTIKLHGVILDDTRVLDSVDDLTTRHYRTINGEPNQCITVNYCIDGQGILGAGMAGTGSITIKDSMAIASTFGYLGYESGSDGTVTVSGPGSTWTNSDKLFVGNSGNGRLSITDGSAVSNTEGYLGYESNSTGAVTVDGPDSTWTNSDNLLVGYEGNGTLSITNGGSVSDTTGVIGSFVRSIGTVTVDGPGSTWTNSHNLLVGSSGRDATLNITNGGAVSNSEGYIGRNYSGIGTVTVDGPGSTWTNNSDLYVGFDGSGTLNITNSGVVVSNARSFIGCSDDAGPCTVTVNGRGSTWTNRDGLFFGSGNNISSVGGTVEITDGGLVSVVGDLMINLNYYWDSSINIDSGGMLALQADVDGSLAEFLGVVKGTGEIRYWDDSISGWAAISGATYGADYSLKYLTDGELAGFTVLTVGAVPEPSTIVLLLSAFAGLLFIRRR
jgi:T5SS/PEP-CTERM-associated repeat protein